MAKILKNTSASVVDLTKFGITIAASSQITVVPQDYPLLAMPLVIAELSPLITAGTIVINDGTNNLSVARAIDYLSLPDFADAQRFNNSSNQFTATDTQSAIEESRYLLTLPGTDQTVYVTKLGNDSTGNGSFGKPYLTIGHALTSITDSSPSKRYTVDVATGDYSENLVLKANIFIKGAGPIATRITGTTININDATWNNSANDSRSGFQDISVNGTGTWDFTAQAGNTQGKLYFFNVRNAAAWTFTGLNAINQIVIQDSEFFGNTTFTGMTAYIGASTWQSGNIVANSSTAAGIPTTLTIVAGMINGNITGTWTSNSAVTLNLAGLTIGASTVLSASGASCVVNANDGSLPIPANRTFASSAVLNRLNDNFARGLLSATTNVDVSAATAPVAGQALVATSPTTAVWSNVVDLNCVEVSDTANATTTSGTDALLTTMTITPSAGTYLLFFNTTITSNNAGAAITVSVYNNGVQDASTVMKISPFDGGTLSATTARGAVGINRTVVVTTGAVQIRWSTSGGTATCGPRVLTMLRIA